MQLKLLVGASVKNSTVFFGFAKTPGGQIGARMAFLGFKWMNVT